jgi:hypothetical protein
MNVKRQPTLSWRECNARPHPGPLPQEREKRSAVTSEIAPAQLLVGIEPNLKDAAKIRTTSGFYEIALPCSLSPGERVRVRASVLSS